MAGGALRIDVDAFDEHLLAARNAESDGAPSLALDHLLAAVKLYRGDLHADVPEAEWLAFERDHYRRRFVTAATRAGQLRWGPPRSAMTMDFREDRVTVAYDDGMTITMVTCG